MEREGASGWCQEGFGTEQFLDAGCGGNWPRGREAAGRRVGAAWPALANFFLFCGAMKGVRGSCAFFFWNPVCKVNVDHNQELAAHYGISSIPVLLIFQNGQIAARHVGVTAEASLRAELQRLRRA